MIMSYFNTQIMLCLIGLIVSSVANAYTQCTLSSPVLLSDKNGEFYLQQVKNPAAGTYTMRLTFLGDNSWIGIGINTADRSKMTPADAVIGRMEDGDGASASVMHYSLTSDSEDASGVQPYSSSTLQNALFEQPDEETSILTFTQDLAEMGVEDSSTWIYAVGLPDNQWTGKHKIHGSFQVALTENCNEIPDPTPAPSTHTPSPTESQTLAATAGENTIQDSGNRPTTTLDPTGAPMSLSSIAPVAATADVPEDFSSNTVVIDDTDPSAFAQAVNAESGGLVVLETAKPYKDLWIAHGVILALAWGIFAPLGIGASILRNTLQERFGQSWYQVHYYVNLVTVLLTTIGFVIAIFAMAKEGEEHFVENTHTRVGLTIMILVVFQALAGYFRPPAASSSKPSNPTARGTTSDEECAVNPRTDEAEAVPSLEKNEKQLAATETDQASTTVSKPMIRFLWEWSHRLGGIVLLGLAWYNCHSGIELQVDTWEDTKDWSSIFWGITGAISGLVFILAYVGRFN